MGTNIRYGSFNVPYFATIERTGEEDGLCWMGGAISWAINNLFERLHPKGFNCTLKEYKDIGSFNSSANKYSGGMLEAVFTGDVDFLTMPVYFPLKDEKEEVEATATFVEDVMTMISFYNVTSDQQNVDILQMYATAPIGVWIAILLSYFSFVIVLHFAIKRYKPGKKTDASWMTTCAFLDQNNFPTTTTKVSALSLLISIAMFFLMSYATNSISTDLVVVEKPTAIKNYQDFLDRAKASPIGEYEVAFCNMLAEYEKFRDAPGDSLEREIFNHHMMVDFSAETKERINGRELQQKVVFVGREVFTTGISDSVLLLYGKSHPESRVLLIKEENPKKYTNVMVWNKKVNSRFQVEVAKILSRMNAGGIMLRTYQNAPIYLAQNVLGVVLGMPNGVPPSMRQRITTKVEEMSPQMLSISMINMKKLILTFCCMTITAITILIYEISYHDVTIRHNKRK